jgi:beta-glucosidase
LEPGDSQKLRFELKPRDMSMVTEEGEPIVAAGEYRISVGGGQPGTGAPSAEGSVQDTRNDYAA